MQLRIQWTLIFEVLNNHCIYCILKIYFIRFKD